MVTNHVENECNQQLFEYNGFLIDFGRNEITDSMKEAFRAGKFERLESRVIRQVLTPGTRVIELGSSTGYVSMLTASIVGAENMFCFEANPKAASLARHHFFINRLSINIRDGILVPRVFADSMGRETDFYVGEQLVSSSLIPRRNTVRVRVPVHILEDEISHLSASFIISDIEGAEVDVFSVADLSGINGIIMEEHGRKVGQYKLEAMRNRLFSLGFEDILKVRQGHVGYYRRV